MLCMYVYYPKSFQRFHLKRYLLTDWLPMEAVLLKISPDVRLKVNLRHYFLSCKFPIKPTKNKNK
jgi:hypothetical protein